MQYNPLFSNDYTFSLSSLSLSLPYLISRQEAELQWEISRQNVRDLIKSLPTSSFERTKLEFDEAFYAAFPAARKAAMDLWIAHHYPHVGPSQDSDSFSMMPSSLNYRYLFSTSNDSRLTPKYVSYTLGGALDPHTSTHVSASSPFNSDIDLAASSGNGMSTAGAGSSQGCSMDHHNALECLPLPEHAPSLAQDEDVLFELEVLAPARRTVQRPARNTRHLRTTPYSSRNPKIIYPSSSSPSKPSTYRSPPQTVPLSSAPFKQPQYTGDWEQDATSASRRLYASANSLIIMDDPATPFPNIRLPEISRVDAAPSAPSSHPQCTLTQDPSSTSPGHGSTTPLPRKRTKLLRDKDGKPLLACLFCRGRKIACGPPPEGSDSPTCNQCARRGLTCHYPTESRRGMRTRKVSQCLLSSDPLPCRSIRKRALLSEDSDSEWDGDKF